MKRLLLLFLLLPGCAATRARVTVRVVDGDPIISIDLQKDIKCESKYTSARS